MLKASDKIAEPFIAEIGEMGREADALTSKILAFHNDVFSILSYARRLVSRRRKPLRPSRTDDHAVEVLTNVDAMRAIILKYADDLPP